MGCLAAATAVLYVVGLRRDEPVFGLAGMGTAMALAFLALPYSAMQDF
jgi:hypothetical protein